MNAHLRRMLGYYLMDEAGADAGSVASGAVAAPVAPAAVADTAASPAAGNTLLTGGEPAPATAAPADTAASAVPEAYTFESKEGFELDQEVLGEATAMFKELGLSQEKASALVGMQQKLMEKLEAGRAAQLEEVLTEQRSRWETEIRNDPDFGGAKFDATVATASKAVQAFGSPELRALLNESGIGSHPEMVKLFHRIGTSITEDRLVMPGGQADANAGKSAADILWPNQN